MSRTINEHVELILGKLTFQLAQSNFTIEELRARIEELEAEKPK